MSQHSNTYTFTYAFIFTAIVAVALALIASGLRPIQIQNEEQLKRSQILGSVTDVNPETVNDDFDRLIRPLAVNTSGDIVAEGEEAFAVDLNAERKKPADERKLPVYEYKNGDEEYLIVPLRGAGLWGPITGFVAFESDLETIYGVVLDHEAETPGLGAEINQPSFMEQYRGKKIFDDTGNYEPVKVLKGQGNNVDGLPHAVDGLSGATMTTNGVTDMFAAGLQYYLPYFNRVKTAA
ncbi:MAG: NADH:ubiquinone reductase (Na(+)-transporting) subunit C [Bacteroidota bacterium]